MSSFLRRVEWFAAAFSLLVGIDARAMCPANAEQLIAVLDATELALAENPLNSKDIAISLVAMMSCAEIAVPPIFTARAWRDVGGGLLTAGENERGMEFLRAAWSIDPAFDMHSEPNVNPALAAAYQHMVDTEPVPLADAAGVASLNDGAARVAFGALGPLPGYVYLDGSHAAPPVPDPDVLSLVNDGCGPAPCEKRPFLAAGATTLAGAGVLFYASRRIHGNLDAAPDADARKVLRLRSAHLLVASIGVGLVGAAAFSWGVVIDAGGFETGVRIKF